jgi:hypothetical protein
MNKKNRYRDKQILIMVTEKEKETIKKNMAVSNIDTMTNYIRKQALYGKVISVNFNDFKHLLEQFSRFNFELNSIGVNVNQIAKKVNVNDEIQLNELFELKLEMEALKNLYERTQKEILDVFKKKLKRLEQK